jgi:predicted site-specific integrase-resolvase
MKYYNAAQAARYLGISDPTIRRWLRPGKHGKIKLASFRTASGELAIAESDVERLRLEINHEREQFITPIHVPKSIVMINHDKDNLTPQVDIDIEQRLASMAQSIANLNATIDIQSRRLNELTKRVAELEARNVPAQSVAPPTTADIPPRSQPQNRRSDASSPVPSDLPPGTLSASDFATILEIPYDHMRNYMRRGVNGEHLDITEIPHHTRPGYSYKYLTREQQEHAMALLRKHGKLS